MAKLKLSEWLQERVQRESRLCLLSPILVVPSVLMATVVTGWVIYMALLLGVASLLGLGGNSTLTATYVVLAVLYVWQFTVGRTHREEWKFSGRPVGAADVVIRAVTGSPFASLALDPAAGKMFVRLWALLLLSGPRLSVLGWELVRRGMRLRAMDVDSCSKVLGVLIKRGARVGVDELIREQPLSTLQVALPQLADVDGVVFLNKDPQGLTVAPRLVDDFKVWREGKAD